MATMAEGDASRAVDAQIEASVLRTAEMFALTKRNTSSALDFAPRYVLLASEWASDITALTRSFVGVTLDSKKIRIATKMRDLYMNIPESLLEDSTVQQAKGGADDAVKTSTGAEAPAPAPGTGHWNPFCAV